MKEPTEQRNQASKWTVRLKIVTGPPTLFNAFQGNESSQRMSEDAWKELSGQQDRANSSRARRFQKKKAAWIDAELAPTDLEPRDDNNVYWFPVDVEYDDGLMCNICRANVGNDKFYKFKENARNCINCSANDDCQYGVDRDQGQFSRVTPELSEKHALMILATRVQHALEVSGMIALRIDVDFKDWLVNVAASFVANAGLSLGEKLMKAVSHMGGVRVPEHQVREIFKSNRGKQFLVMRTVMLDPVSQEKIHEYRLSKDCGNVLYKDFLVKILDSAEKMNEIFGPTMATAKKAGDVIEFLLGLLDIAAMTKGVVNILGDDVDPTKFLNGLEAAVRLFSKVARTTSTINSKRKGSFDCTLDARESDEVMNRLNNVDAYQRSNLFKAAMVLELSKDITQARDPMDTSSSGNPDAPSGSPNQRVEGGTPEGEQPFQLEALGSFYSTAEDANLCLYCGSTQHDHFECDHQNREIIKNALDKIRGCMHEGESAKAEADESTVDPSGSGQNVNADAAAEEEISDDEDDPVVGQMYDKPTYINVIGDRDELGRGCIAGQRVDQRGPTSRDQVDEVVREALMRGTGDRWNVADFYKNSSDVNRGRSMHEEIIDYTDGFFQIVPTNQCKFHYGFYDFYGIEYGIWEEIRSTSHQVRE